MPANGISSRNGFGVQTALMPVTQDAAGVRSVLTNVGVGIQIIAAGGGTRLTKIAYRVDLAPDVAAGTVISPDKWRLVAFSAPLPADISALQQQAFSTGAHPEIPAIRAAQAPFPLLRDVWLDFSAGDPGLNRIAEIDWADAGPNVGKTEFISIVLVPILDATLSQALPGAANALMYLEAYGAGVSAAEAASVGSIGGPRSLARFDVDFPGE